MTGIGVSKQFFVHLAALVPRWQGSSRALPLRLDPAFPPKAVPSAAEPRTEGPAALLQMRWRRAAWEAAGRRAHELLGLGDGHDDTVDLWTQRPERTACNRVLDDLPPPGAWSNRRHAARATRPDSWLAERRG
jgi:hypothetical protein